MGYNLDEFKLGVPLEKHAVVTWDTYQNSLEHKKETKGPSDMN
jgi:hypothetical protein